jgi:hypothetical protein
MMTLKWLLGTGMRCSVFGALLMELGLFESFVLRAKGSMLHVVTKYECLFCFLGITGRNVCGVKQASAIEGLIERCEADAGGAGQNHCREVLTAAGSIYEILFGMACE